MEVLLNSAQMKACDQAAIYKTGIPSMVLMERAALSVVDEMMAGGLNLTSVLVVCGSGNNGGDGFAIARLLKERDVSVTLAFVGKETSMTEETALQKQICENCGIKICTNFQEREYTTIVDAIFGIGLSRAIEGGYAQVIEWMNRSPAQIVAVDIPSGISADTGKVLGTAVRAALTVTFAFRKPGQILYPGTEYCGKLICRRIGISLERGMVPAAFTYTEEDLGKVARRRAYSNKGSYGKVLLIAGSRGMSGAAYLSALSAYRSGTGLVRILTPECNREIIQNCLPEAMVTSYDSSQDAVGKLRELFFWADVIGIGPGVGTGPVSEELLNCVLKESTLPLVIDADGLNLLAKQPSLLNQAKGPVIVTPHVGEMMRLTGKDKTEITGNLMECTREYAKQNQVICVLKDARTAVSDGGQIYLNTSGNHGMAVGGSGDVLTGVICGLLSQGMQPFEAAAEGVFIHGLAGDLARKQSSAYGMIAGDIADQIGVVLKKADV